MLRLVFSRIYVSKYFCLRIIENQKMCFNVFNFVKHTARLRHIGVVKKCISFVAVSENKSYICITNNVFAAWETGASGRMSARSVGRKTGRGGKSLPVTFSICPN